LERFRDEKAVQYCVDGQRSGWSDCYLYRSGGGSPWFVTINLQQPYEISEIRVYAKEIYLNWMTQFQLVVSESALSDPELVAHAVAYSHAGGSGGAPVIPGAVPDEDRIVVVGSAFLRQTRGQFVTLMLVNSDIATPEVQEIEVYGEPRPEEPSGLSSSVIFRAARVQSALAAGTVRSSADRHVKLDCRSTWACSRKPKGGGALAVPCLCRSFIEIRRMSTHVSHCWCSLFAAPTSLPFGSGRG